MENIDTTTPSGRFMFNILGALSSMEREFIVERTRAGLLRLPLVGAEVVVLRRSMRRRSGLSGRADIRQHVGQRSRAAAWMCTQHAVSASAGWPLGPGSDGTGCRVIR